MKCLAITVALSAGLLCMGCAAHTSLIPLGEGRLAPNLSIGGPLVEAFGTHVPIPYLTTGAEYGVSDQVNANASLHLLPLAYKVIGLDVGTTWFPIENDGWRPTLGVGPRLFAFASMKNNVEDHFLFYPAASGSAAWTVGSGLFYTGADLATPLSRPEFDEEAKPLIVSPFVGYRWNVGRRYALLTELKWHGVNIETDNLATGYTSIGSKGAVTPLFAFQRRF